MLLWLLLVSWFPLPGCSAVAVDPLNTSYLIEGLSITLQNGSAEVASVAGSTARVRTSVAGEVCYGDLDADGDEDAALILIHDPGGSGSFYYLAAALNAGGRYQGTNSLLLGDRIQMQNLAIHTGVIEVGFKAHAPDVPLGSKPSVDKYMGASVVDGALVVVKLPGMD